jgi:hypothetical protein
MKIKLVITASIIIFLIYQASTTRSNSEHKTTLKAFKLKSKKTISHLQIAHQKYSYINTKYANKNPSDTLMKLNVQNKSLKSQTESICNKNNIPFMQISQKIKYKNGNSNNPGCTMSSIKSEISLLARPSSPRISTNPYLSLVGNRPFKSLATHSILLERSKLSAHLIKFKLNMKRSNDRKRSNYYTYENQTENQSHLNSSEIDINNYLNQFNTIPDSASECAITIMVDLPADDDYGKYFHSGKGYIGHVFIALSKSLPIKTIIEYIGFYPQNPIRGLLSNIPVPPKFKDNQLHGYDASLKMDLRPESLRLVIQEIKELARYAQYSINNYNCTDFSLQVINTIRGVNPLIIPKNKSTQLSNSNDWNTPEGLYILLEKMKNTGCSESNNIIISNSKLYAGPTSGTK